MPQNYILGIGGTGARCVEATLHLCAAGLGPKDLWVGFVDQDAGHANLDVAKKVLQQVDQLRTWFREDSHDRVGTGELPLLNTALWAAGGRASVLGEKDPVAWYPAPADATVAMTLEGIFSWNTAGPETRALMQALYHRGSDGLAAQHSEHRIPLDVGFRGRPSLAAAVILGQADMDATGFWTQLEAKIKVFVDNPTNGPARVLFVGSVFGGTGAGGLPVLARRLRKVATQNKWPIDISCVLMGPYFSYEVTDASLGLNANPAEFNAKLRGAFQYYAHMLSREKVFDRVYLAGWPERFNFGGAKDVARNGGLLQRNPATIPELYAALAAADYFMTDTLTSGPTQVYGTSLEGEYLPTRDDGKSGDTTLSLTWEDLPVPPGLTRLQMRARIATFIRFCLLFQTIFRYRLTELTSRRAIEREIWYHRLVRPALAAEDRVDRDEKLRMLGAYAEHALRWWGGMVLLDATSSGASANHPRALVNANLFAAKSNDKDTGTLMIDVAKDLSSPNLHSGFARMTQGEVKPPSLTDIYRTLSHAPISRDATGIGSFVRALFDAAAA